MCNRAARLKQHKPRLQTLGMKIKKILGQIHLWIGLVVGLLFFVIAFSGALYTWMPEMSRLAYNEAVEPQALPFVPISSLKSTLDREFPEGDFRTAYCRDRASTAEVLLYVPGTYYKAFLNPYTGELVHLQDMKTGWLHYLKDTHRNLMLGDFGRNVVHWVTLLSFLMFVTGLVLWWPNKQAGKKRCFTLKWGKFTKRLNYDMHNVLGFYASLISIFAILTGIYWGFDFAKDAVRVGTGGDEVTYATPLSDEAGVDEAIDQFALMDSMMVEFKKQHPSKFIRMSNPHSPTDPINVVVIDPDQPAFMSDHYYFDRYSGKQIKGNFENSSYADASGDQLINQMVYDIHFGSILGFPGRMLMFLASLIASSLPITGFFVWWGKRKK